MTSNASTLRINEFPDGDAGSASPSDEEIVRRIVAGESCLFEILMRRYNQRLFRVARSIVRSPPEAEDVVQQAYVSAYSNLEQFGGRAAFSTWLTRIVVHEALARIRVRKRGEVLSGEDGSGAADERRASDPEEQASTRQLARFFEEAYDALPDIYRVVFMMRGIEEMSTAETSACLDLSEDTVKVRFHRARALLRTHLDDRMDVASRDAFAFLGAKCASMVARVNALLDFKGSKRILRR